MAARTFPDGDRKRLGRLLTERRIQLNPAYRNRQHFVNERGLNYRLVSDIERARRTDFGDSTLIALDLAYGWATGSILRVLGGGDPDPVVASPAPPEAVLIRQARLAGKLESAEVAGAAGIPPADLAQIEAGTIRAPADTLARLAAAVGVTATELAAVPATGKDRERLDEAVAVLERMGREGDGTESQLGDDPELAELIRLWKTFDAEQKRLIMVMARATLAPKPAAKYGTNPVPT